MRRLLIALLVVLLPCTAAALDTEALGPVTSGNSAGKARVALLESQLASMTIKSGHPRIFLTDEMIAKGRARVGAGFPQWSEILTSAGGTLTGANLACAAFAYVMLAESNPSAAATHAANVYNAIVAAADPAPVPGTTYDTTASTTVAWWALAYDWVYNGLTTEQRTTLQTKIATAANISGRAAWIRAGNKFEGTNDKSSFHRELWIWTAYKTFPEVALAGDVTDADFCYYARWRYDWIYGDAARWWAYLNDGSNVEGYQLGADGIEWFMTLKSATGINLVDGLDVSYGKQTGDFVFYNTDFAQNRRIMHFGVNSSKAAHSWEWGINTGDNWKPRANACQAVQYDADNNPYHQYFLQTLTAFNSVSNRCPSHWPLVEMSQSSSPDATQPIVSLLYYNPADAGINPATATYEQLPYGKFFSGAGEMNSRTSWGANAARMVQRYRPAWVRSGHLDYSVGEFVLYRGGNLAPDAGLYDTILADQANYKGFKKNTVGHNALLIVDPAKPTAPWRSGGAEFADPGGVNWVGTLNLGTNNESFLHRPAADQGKVLQQETTPLYDFITGDTSTAYGDGSIDTLSAGASYTLQRVSESTRSTLFLRPGSDKAYVLVFDRINSDLGGGNYKKKWLIHTTTEPAVSGTVTDVEVADHVYSLNGTTWQAKNAQDTSAMYGKILLPTAPVVRKIGGAGYEFWVDGATGRADTSGRNLTVDWALFRPDVEALTANPMEEIGTWRLEVSPPTTQTRDVFFNVIYMGDVGETIAEPSLIAAGTGRQGAFIKHSSANNYFVAFNTQKYGTQSSTLSYALTASTEATTISHVITELAPGATYRVRKNGAEIGSYAASAQGTLSFTTTGSGAYVVETPPTYYVNPLTGNDGNDGKSPENAWQTIGKVNTVDFLGGDVVRFASGDHGSTTLIPKTSGTPSKPIIYTSYAGAATKPVLRGGVNLTGKNYVKIDGLDISSSGNAILINGGSYNVVTNSTIYSSATAWVNAVALKNGAHYNQITDNTISQASGNNDIVNLRNDTDYNLIKGNTITIENSHAAIDLEGWTIDDGGSRVGDGTSNWNIIRGNTVIGHNGGGALINLNANSNYNVVDNNTLKGDSTVANFCNLTSQPAMHQDMFKLVGEYNIARNNTLSNYPCKDAMGIEMSPYVYGGFTNNSRYQHVYHNVITGIGAGATPLYLFGYNGGVMADNVIKNNIIYNNGGTHWQTDSTGSLASDSLNLQLRDSPAGSYFTNNLIWKSGHSGALVWLGDTYKTVEQANTDSSYWDGNLSADPILNADTFLPENGSPAPNSGADLTTITSASGEGTSFAVADAYYFTDGNGITTGDTIKVNNQVTTITDITYGSGLTGTLTVSSPVVWSQGGAVNLAFDGSAPPIGLIRYTGGNTQNEPATSATRIRASFRADMR